MDLNLIKARSYYYEFFAIPFFFYENGAKFSLWKEQLEFLKSSPISEADAKNFEILQNFSFEEFRREQNDVLFDFSFVNVPTTASFYDEGRDEGRMKILITNTLKKSKFRRNSELCKDSEDFVGFIFYLQSSLLRDEAEAQNGNIFLSAELFASVINEFCDHFMGLLKEHKSSKFFRALAGIMESFFALERSLLALPKPQKDKNIAKESINAKLYRGNFKNAKHNFEFDE